MATDFKPFNILSHCPTNGLHLVEASAGTGKTYSIVGLVLHLILSRPQTTIANILVVTFTNAATGELTVRIRQALSRAVGIFSREAEPGPGDELYTALAKLYGVEKGLPLLRRALTQFDEARISTIHSFCSQVLQESAFECGVPFSATFIESDSDLLLQAAQDFWRTHLVEEPLTATLIDRWQWTPESLIDGWRQSRRFPETTVLPAKSEPAPLFAELADLLTTICSHAATSQLLADWNRAKVFKKNKRPACPGDDPVALLSESAFHGLTAVLNLALDLGDPGFDQRLMKVFLKSCDLDQDPLVLACRQLSEAAARCRAVCLSAFVHEVDGRFADHKKKMGLLSYDDLLSTLARALDQPRMGHKVRQAVDKRFHAALIDEFQDTDRVQYNVFQQLFAAKPCYIIGDPKQAIYSFRGADVFTYLEAAERAAEKRYTLETNWRSHSRMVEAVNRLFDQVEAPFIRQEIGFTPAKAQGLADSRELRGDDRAPLTWMLFPGMGAKDEARRLVCEACGDEIVHLLASEVNQAGDPLGPGKIAVLVNTNDQARLIRQVLARRQVPVVLSQAGNIFTTEEMGELRTLLRAVLWPGRASRMREACLTRIWGMSSAELVAVRGDDRAWQRLADRLDTWRQQWRDQGFMAMFEEICTVTELRCRFLGMESGSRRLTNLLQAAELAHCIQSERGLAPGQLLEYLDLEAGGAGREGREVTELGLETDSQAVQVVTVHKSKGLEYEVVFCPFLWEGRSARDTLPAVAHVGGAVICDFGSPELNKHRDLAEEERLAEDLRKLYVALTRAKQRCYLFWGRAGKSMAGAGEAGLTSLLKGHLAATGTEPQECDPKAITGVVHDLVQRFPELMACLEVEPPSEDQPLAVWQAEKREAELRPVRCSTLSEEDPRLQTWRLTSFSSMSRGRGAGEYDSTDHGDSEFSTGAGDEKAAKGIFAFARGAHAGTCLHAILENIDFRDSRSGETREKVAALLKFHGLDKPGTPHKDGVGEPLETVMTMLASLCVTPVDFGGDHTLVLEDLSPEECLIEWEFHTRLQSLAPRDLAQVIDTCGSKWPLRGYAAHLAKLSSVQVHGFLKGFVDLICCQQGRWFVIDWKSNHLGNSRDDYSGERLTRAMFSHHYVLQYLLYSVALDRFLKRHQSGYDYGRHFGGVGYAFLRGGWFVDRPPARLIEALGQQLIGKEER